MWSDYLCFLNYFNILYSFLNERILLKCWLLLDWSVLHRYVPFLL